MTPLNANYSVLLIGVVMAGAGAQWWAPWGLGAGRALLVDGAQGVPGAGRSHQV